VNSLLALKEEHLHIRESIVVVREQELEKRRELEELARAREAIAAEVLQLERARKEQQERGHAEQRQLERQSELMKDKLERCRDAVAFAVGSIDEIYGYQEAAPTQRRSDVGACEGHSLRSSLANGGDGSSHQQNLSGRLSATPGPLKAELENAKALAEEAGAEVNEILATWDEDQENIILREKQTKRPEDSIAQAPTVERTPLRSCNSFVSP
jgi:hypothetical protein